MCFAFSLFFLLIHFLLLLLLLFLRLAFLLTLVSPNSISITSSGPHYGTNRTIVPPATDVTITLIFTLPNVTWVFNDEDIQLINNPGFNVTGPFVINTDTDLYKVCVHCLIDK